MRFHQSRLVHDFIYQGVLSVLQQQLDAPLAEKDDPPAPRPMPENRIAAGGNQFCAASGSAGNCGPLQHHAIA
ncbi:DNA mismatch repair protein MutL [Klebsiella pneumoniae subsp. ozaenae]|uniref:DNA mismatch repair protein MutL n=1 Tax=Klebsiella pneumoniae subsp. ozaenae TaxID=574 RepID=A0A378AZ26_KLEPO|nr:DNA mismatch repair protein MutL [Klebsiella pneumoniae subsp. ozaenae]